MSPSDRVVLGMDPHKRSAMIEVMACNETVLGQGRFDAEHAGYPSMLAYAQRWPDRVWAIEGCQGIGRHIERTSGRPPVDRPGRGSAAARAHRRPASANPGPARGCRSTVTVWTKNRR